MALHTLLFLLLGVQSVLANVEKTIFLGPQTANIPQQSPSLDDLHIDVLTPDNWSLRTHVEANFPDVSLSDKGKSTWLILDNLTESQRYEVRICWIATVRCSLPPFYTESGTYACTVATNRLHNGDI